MKLVAGSIVVLFASSVLAQESAPSAAVPGVSTEGVPRGEALPDGMSDSRAEAQSDEAAWDLAMVQVPWTEPAGRSFAIGYSHGSWGGRWTQNIQLHIPFALWGAVVIRGIAIGGAGADRWDRWDLGGRLELRGQGPVFLNFVRIYGGGGVQVLTSVSGGSGSEAEVGGGGYFGFEFFNARWVSFFIEIGGQGGGPAAGATIMAGVQAYPF